MPLGNFKIVHLEMLFAWAVVLQGQLQGIFGDWFLIKSIVIDFW